MEWLGSRYFGYIFTLDEHKKKAALQ